MPGLGNAVDASTTGFQSLNAATGVWVGRSLIAGTGISITNINGVAGNPTISSTAFTTVAMQTFTANGTYTPTAGMKYCIIEMVGGGGAGGGAAAVAATLSSGSGGGGGEYARGVFSAATIGVSQAVTIGAAGTQNSGAAGGNGGNTSVGALISAFGGTGGGTIPAFTTTSKGLNGSAGGTGGAGGSFRLNGGAGGITFALNAPPGNAMIVAGVGGNSFFAGISPAGVLTQIIVSEGSVGGSATGRGGGGSGAYNFGTLAAQLGGAATAGLVVVTEYI